MAGGRRPKARGQGLRAEYDDVEMFSCVHLAFVAFSFMQSKKFFVFVDDRFRRLPFAYLTSGVVKCWIYEIYVDLLIEE